LIVHSEHWWIGERERRRRPSAGGNSVNCMEDQTHNWWREGQLEAGIKPVRGRRGWGQNLLPVQQTFSGLANLP